MALAYVGRGSGPPARRCHVDPADSRSPLSMATRTSTGTRRWRTVETTAGHLRGVDIDGVATFLGVPYGDRVDDEWRFRPPRPHPGWSGVRDALTFGAAAPQTDPTGRRGTHLSPGAPAALSGGPDPARGPCLGRELPLPQRLGKQSRGAAQAGDGLAPRRSLHPRHRRGGVVPGRPPGRRRRRRGGDAEPPPGAARLPAAGAGAGGGVAAVGAGRNPRHRGGAALGTREHRRLRWRPRKRRRCSVSPAAGRRHRR